jgi:phosphate starvation-inducible protein PhoH
VSKKKQNGTNGNGHVYVKSTVPLTKNQEKAFDAFPKKNLLLHGWAGTGKTYIGLYLALKEILETFRYEKLYIIRSAVASRSIGYLPGDLDEKLEVFETPYISIVNELTDRWDGYNYLKSKDMIEFTSTSYLRGVTMENCIVLVDEIQNMLFHELDTIITRSGKNMKMIMAGDYHQTDLINGTKFEVLDFMGIIQKLDEFVTVEFGIKDIVRNDLVKSYLIAKENRNIFQRI